MLHDVSSEKLPILIMNALITNNDAKFAALTRNLQPYDLALIFTSLPDTQKSVFLKHLSVAVIADLIKELNHSQQLELLKRLTTEKVNQVLDEMDNDDLAPLLHDLSPHKMKAFLQGMKKEEAAFVQHLMTYPPETAGRLMTNRFVWIHSSYLVQEAIEKIKSFAVYAETINYIYVVNENHKLVGVVSYRDLLFADTKETMKNIMCSRVITVPVLTDQEEVAHLMRRYDFLAIPVVNDEGILLGIVTFDDVLDILHQEANEDIEKLAASGKAIDFHTRPSTAAFRRLPWLIILLFIGLVSGSIIASFEETLEKVVALAFFMPMIAGMTGNTGTQSLAIVVRGLTSEQLDAKAIIQLILREFAVSLMIGLACGILMTIIAYIWQGDLMLGVVVGSSLLLTLMIGTMSGTIIPLILYRLHIDPAVASGPLITTINDIFSLIIYFTIASWFLLS